MWQSLAHGGQLGAIRPSAPFSGLSPQSWNSLQGPNDCLQQIPVLLGCVPKGQRSETGCPASL